MYRTSSGQVQDKLHTDNYKIVEVIIISMQKLKTSMEKMKSRSGSV